jgi:DNA-directed RNA polymerase subunit M/transcription elongation factor TFIIS
MKFCSHCDNMMYVNVSEDKKLVHYCKACNNKEVQEDKESFLVISDNKIDDTTKYAQFVNKYLKYDPTLPRVNNIVCPNAECVKKEVDPNEVIYIKYDTVNMKYLYYCCHCDYFWKST